jgi:hypothetical protein
VGARPGAAGLGTDLEETERGEPPGLGVVVALRGSPEDRALAHHPDDVVRPGTAAPDERKDHDITHSRGDAALPDRSARPGLRRLTTETKATFRSTEF